MNEKVSNRPLWKTFKKILGYTVPYKQWVIINIIFSTANASLSVLTAYFMKRFVDVAQNGNTGQLFTLMIMVLFMLLGGIVVVYVSRYSAEKFAVSTMRDIRNKLLEHIEGLHVSYIESGHTGELVSRMTNDASIVGNFLQSELPFYFSLTASVTMVFAYLLSINWQLLLFSMIMMPAAIYLSNKLSKPIGESSKRVQEKLGTANSIVQETIGAIQMLKAYNMQETIYGKYKTTVDEALSQSLVVEKKRVFLVPVTMSISIGPFLLSAILGGYMSVKGIITPGEVVAFTYLLFHITYPLSHLPNNISNYRSSVSVAGRLFELMELPVERENGSKFDTKNTDNALEFDNVKFMYKKKVPVLDGLSFSIKKGTTTAIVGSSGCGKSTVFKLLCGFYEANDGLVKLFNKIVDDWKLTEARNLVSLVSQDTYLFPTTIRGNIGYGKKDAVFEEIVEAAKAANAHDFIMELAEGYETLVGERGIRLSGGQKQRLSLARAILKDAPILLLDEPTSALDTESEALVQEALTRLMINKTVLVAAHRLSSIKKVDCILVLDDGRIAGKGTHDELFETNVIYRDLYIRQFAVS